MYIDRIFNLKKKLFIFHVLSLLLFFQTSFFAQNIFIRTNQLGYLPSNSKEAIILSNELINNTSFSINNFFTNEITTRGKIGLSEGSYGNFSYVYKIDFSNFNKLGKYYIQLNNNKSVPFIINQFTYNSILDSVITFFKIQRCGFNDPYLHEFCHYYDATNLILNGVELKEKMDLTGGWHDAGDYIKFLNTIAYTTYTLLFSYDFDPIKFGKDKNKNDVPDILEEAKIGLEWLIKANYKNEYLITQVQDLQDQNVGWRLPGKDPLVEKRPAFIGIGKNLIGIYSATLALGSRIFNHIPGNDEFSISCLELAENFYSLKDTSPNIYKTPTGHYEDSKFLGKIALASIELFLLTNKKDYLMDAKKYATEAGSDFWWSWGDINSYAHYRLAKFDSSFINYIYENLKHFQELSNSNIFHEVINDTWGTNSTNLGVALQSILYFNLTGDSTFNKLAADQRDYILGKNPWGISFVYNIGSQFTKHFHSQVAYFNNGKLTGALSAGPISKSKLNKFKIVLENTIDQYNLFQTDNAAYYDDRMDYITNEPTITANATAVFVFGYYSNP